MPSKFQMYRQMADKAAKQITGSFQGWTSFLTTAARLLMAMSELELSEARLKALPDSSTPLADIFEYYENMETNHMDAIHETTYYGWVLLLCLTE